MPFNRMRSRTQRFRNAPIVQSVKNQFEVTQSTVAGTGIVRDLASAVEIGGATKVTGVEVPVGAKIFSITLTQNFITQSGSVNASFNFYVMKVRGGQTDNELPAADFTAIGLSNLRNQIFYSLTTEVGTQDAGPFKMTNRRIKIPRIYQRMRAGDRIVVVATSDEIGTYKTGVIYKYYQ